MWCRTHLSVAAVLAMVVSAPARAQFISRDHPGQYAQEDIAAGSRIYSVQCQQCHGRDGDQISGVDLRRGTFRRGASDEDLARVIASGTAGGMPPFRLSPAELTAVVAFIRAGFDATASVRIGDAARGRTLFEGKGACASCHRVAGRGPLLSPDLSDVGLARTPAALERSLRDPSSAMLPINRPVRLLLDDGRTIRGRRLNEDTHTVQLLDDAQQLQSIAKRDVRRFEIETVSPMPSYAGRLSDEEIADLVAYLLTLREP